jgi:hypothetical protein
LHDEAHDDDNASHRDSEDKNSDINRYRGFCARLALQA